VRWGLGRQKAEGKRQKAEGRREEEMGRWGGREVGRVEQNRDS